MAGLESPGNPARAVSAFRSDCLHTTPRRSGPSHGRTVHICCMNHGLHHLLVQRADLGEGYEAIRAIVWEGSPYLPRERSEVISTITWEDSSYMRADGPRRSGPFSWRGERM